MTFSDTLASLYQRRRFGMRPGLERIRTLLARLGNPERTFRAIHVAGTNGKGSSSAFLSSILTKAGIRTGLFTSPHLVSFTERFRICGAESSERELTPLMGKVLAAAPEESTFFEVTTALGVLYFAEHSVQAAVMEAGMGGASDATAALSGELAVITPISLDHCEWLGSSIKEIAAEKCGIIKQGTSAVSAPQTAEAHDVITAAVTAASSRLFMHGRDFSASWTGPGMIGYSGIHRSLDSITPGIPGRYQLANAATALAAAEVFLEGVPVGNNALKSGVADASWPGRMELVPGSVPILLDGAHNSAGMLALAESLEPRNYGRIFMVAGIMADKEASAMFLPLAGSIEKAFAVCPAVERAMPASSLASALNASGIRAEACSTVRDGIEAARLEASEGDMILVCGSLFAVGEAKAFLEDRCFQGIRG